VNVVGLYPHCRALPHPSSGSPDALEANADGERNRGGRAVNLLAFPTLGKDERLLRRASGEGSAE